MIRDKNKFIASYKELSSSGKDIFSGTIFSFTTNYSTSQFESILDANDSRLDNISFLNKESEKFKLLSIGKIKDYTLKDYSKNKINNIIREIIDTSLSINETNQKNIPLILCGQNYDLSKSNNNIWANIPSLNYWVPKILLLSYDNRTTLTHFFDTNTNIDDIISTIEENHTFIDKILNTNHTDKYYNNTLTSNKFLTDKDTFEGAITKIKNHINNSDVSKVVISNILSCDINKKPSYSNIIEKLKDNYSTCCVFYYRYNDTQSFIGASPETILKKETNIINIDALAGSKPVISKHQLLNDKKIQKEHEFVVEGIIETLKSINIDCKVQESYILELKNIAHLKTEITSKINSEHNPLNILDTLVPTAALSGYPRGSSMDIIDSIEENERGWYAGPIGWIDSEMNCEFYAALRSAYINNNKIYFYGGAGIVINSDSDEEWKEIVNKIDSIYNIING